MALDPGLRLELLRRRSADQEPYRRSPPARPEEMLAVFEANAAWLQSVVEEKGWPGRSMVGEDGADAAWLIVQHADDIRFQRHCLALLEAAVAAGEASPANAAYLIDRVRVREGRPQVYGTQFRPVGDDMEPFPLEDPDGVDARRATAGLIPLADYAAGFRRMRRP